MEDSSAPEPRPKREPAIHTMRSDVSEFLKTSKASQLSILIEEVKKERPPTEPARNRTRQLKIALLIFLVAAALAGGLSLYFFWIGSNAPPPPIRESTPRGFIVFDVTQEITLAPTPGEFRKVLLEARHSPEPVGSFRRLVIRSQNPAGASVVIGMAESLRRLEVRAPAGFLGSVTSAPQFFTYQGALGPRFGILAEVASQARAWEALLGWEPSLQNDLEPFFLGEEVALSFQPFEDKTYRNIDFRYLALDPAQSRGIGYLYFPARHLIIIATSDETIRKIIDRLFESR